MVESINSINKNLSKGCGLSIIKSIVCRNGHKSQARLCVRSQEKTEYS